VLVTCDGRDYRSRPQLRRHGRYHGRVQTFDLAEVVQQFARSLKRVDQRGPVAKNARSGERFQPGIGPHTESQTVAMVIADAGATQTGFGAHTFDEPYPAIARARCDLCVGTGPTWDWCIEVKMLRMMGDNGKPNDNMLMHILSPYPSHRSALTDIDKLARSGFQGRKAVLIYGYDYDQFPMEPAVAAFELLGNANAGRLGPRRYAGVDGLIHPVHSRGGVYGWEVLP
jgi:hypothetical protein